LAEYGQLELTNGAFLTLKRLKAFILLGRPLFLVGGIVMHGLGAAIALYNGVSIHWAALLWGQIAISACQWMTHYANDYFDLAADRANRTPTNWSGGSRILAEARLAPRVAHITALIFAVVAVVAALVLAFVVQTGALTLPLIAIALALAWFYSAPPIRLHSRGFGELTTALLVPTLVPLTGYYLQSGRLDLLPLLASFPLGCLQFCMLLAIEFPDETGDRAVHKGTLVVRLGAKRAAKLYMTVLMLAYLSLPLLVIAGLPRLPALAIALMSPLALWQLRRARRGDIFRPEHWNQFAFFSVALLIGTGVVEPVSYTH
jgi:1,4-dihydroxy-2-naphthoate octaprenyltransferase